MAVTRLEIISRAPYANGCSFGDAGAYERIDGVLHFAVEPEHEANRAIVDLDRAMRDADGRVRFQADFCLLQPVDPARGSRRLLYEVLNRGRKGLTRMFNNAPPEAVPSYAIDPGDGFLLRRGWTLAWCGWQWDVIATDALLGLEAPEALTIVGDRPVPIAGQIQVTFQPNEASADLLLADRVHQPYPAANPDDQDATLSVAEWRGGEATPIPRDRWRFARAGEAGPVTDDAHIWLDGGFQAGRVYTVVYTTRRSPVVGAGLLAMRDCVAWLRHGTEGAGNPAAGRLDHTFVYGVSQSGRYLRQYLYDGLNLDESGRRVFDGILCHVAGARRGEFNHRYAQPSQQHTPNFGHLAPFADDPGADGPGLLDRQRLLGGVPKIFYTNTAAEYWRGDGALVHLDARGERDLPDSADSRAYLLASAQHGPGTLPLTRHNPNDGASGEHAFNALDYSPLMRAALANLDAWVTEGVEPPPSVVPRLADGTAVPHEQVFETYRTFPGATIPDPDLLPHLRRFDLGPQAEQRIGRYPAMPGEPYPAIVSAVDADGNETGGVRMPDVAVPIATYTGWNPRHPATGGPGQIIPMQGTTLPFARTKEEREASGDPRPSVAERYRDRDDYLARVRAAAEALAEQRYLLAEDISLAVELAAERYDALVG
ncbi:MAG: alpha/beta hydrolase domain-containing protein [Chloroflexia bacterium]